MDSIAVAVVFTVTIGTTIWLIADSKRVRNLFHSQFIPVDRPGAIIPGEVIRRFPLLSDLPKLIGMDLHYLTSDVLAPMDIPLGKSLDGTVFSGNVLVHSRYWIMAESGTDVNGHPYWIVDVFANNVGLDYWVELCEKLAVVYGPPFRAHGAGKFTGLDLEETKENKATGLKMWLNQTLLPGFDLKKCQLSLRSYEYGRIANLHYYIHE